MKKRTLSEIAKIDTAALTAIIDYWKDYESNTVLLAYAELKRRNYSLDGTLTKLINDFCSRNNSEDIDALLSSALSAIGYNSYDECYEKEVAAMRKAATVHPKIEIGASITDNVERKYPALRTISAIYKFFGWVIIIATLIVAFILGQGSGISALITIIAGALIVLGVFAVAESIMVFIDIEHNTRTIAKN